MKNIKYYKRLILIALTSSVVLVTGCSKTLLTTEPTESKIVDTETNYDEETKINEFITEKNKIEENNEVSNEVLIETESSKEQVIENNDEIKTIIETVEELETTVNDSINSEEDVVNFFGEISNQAESWTLSDKYENVKEKITTGFATFVLFMNDDTTIGGYTFSSLSETSKQKIETLFIKMDTTIENKFPNYKEKIGEKWNVAKVFVSDKYQNIKSKVKIYIIEKVGEENYDEALNNFSGSFEELKDSFSNTFHFIGDKIDEKKEQLNEWAKQKVKK